MALPLCNVNIAPATYKCASQLGLTPASLGISRLLPQKFILDLYTILLLTRTLSHRFAQQLDPIWHCKNTARPWRVRCDCLRTPSNRAPSTRVFSDHSKYHPTPMWLQVVF